MVVDDDDAMLTHVSCPSDVALPMVVVLEMMPLLLNCDAVLTDKVVETANVMLVDDFADVVEADEDVPVDVLTVVLGPQDALATDTAELDCRDELALGCVETGTENKKKTLLRVDNYEAMLTFVLGPIDVALR